MSAELEARRTAAAAVLADYRRELHSAPLSKPPGREWMFRLERVLADLLAVLDQCHAGQEDAPSGAVGQPAAVPEPGLTAGPFETEAQVRELPAVRAVYAAFDADPGVGKMAPHNFLMLVKACEAAGVGLGGPSSYDRQILAWLAGWEPSTCAVVAGLITRAHRPELEEAPGVLLEPFATLGQADAATALDALEVAAEYRRHRASLTCEATHPAELCDDHQADLDRADEYDTLAQQITEAIR